MEDKKIKEETAAPAPICYTCHIRDERDRLYDENQRLKQILKQINGITAPAAFNF